MSGGYGDWIEDVVREIAAEAGVPDFVFKAVQIDKGGGRREVGDALLWIGRQLVVVSVKSRDPDVGVDSPERRESWLGKNIKKAVSQINGTVRTLTAPPLGLILRSERGVDIPWDRSLVDEISGVVVVDYPDPWDHTPDTSAAVVPTVVMASEDWHRLHTRLWSTASVVGYTSWRTRSGLPPVPLAAERDVIAASHLAEADLPRGTRFKVSPGAWDRAWTERPDIFFGTESDHRYARVIDAMIAGAAEMDPLYTNVKGPSDYLHIIEFLDRIPPFTRVLVGKAVVAKCEGVGRDDGFDAMIGLPGPGLFLVLADDAGREERARRIRSLTLARHTQLVEASGDPTLITLGIATEPMPSSGRSHDFVFIRSAIALDEDERRLRDQLFGPLPDELVAKASARSGGC